MRGVASHADFLGVSRDSQMEKTLFAVDELSGFIIAVAYVRPDGHPRDDAQVGQEEAQAAQRSPPPSTATSCAQGAEELGVDFDEHLAFVIAALEAQRGRARARRLRRAVHLT